MGTRVESDGGYRMKKTLIFAGIALAAIAAYLVADKPVVHTIETKDSTGTTRRLTINILVGAGNTINYNYKDES